MLNEEVCYSNVDIHGVAVKVKGGAVSGERGEVRVKKEKNVALTATQGDGPTNRSSTQCQSLTPYFQFDLSNP